MTEWVMGLTLPLANAIAFLGELSLGRRQSRHAITVCARVPLHALNTTTSR